MTQMKLGTKIILGFAFLLIITLALGLMAIYQMFNGKSISERLANEYVPEVNVAVDLERYVLLATRDLVMYSFTEDKTLLAAGRKKVANVGEYITEARALAAKYPALVKLREDLPKVDAKHKEWQVLIDETEKSIGALDEARKALDEAAQAFVTHLTGFQNEQVETAKKEFVEGAPTEKLLERNRKIDWVADWSALGTEVRVAAQKAQARRDPQILKEAMPLFDKMSKVAQDIRAVTTRERNIKQIEDALAAQTRYKTAMESLQRAWQKLEEVAKKRVETIDIMKELCADTSEAGMKNTSTLSQNVAGNMSASGTIMVIGLVVAAITGVLAAIFITRSITKPLTRAIEGLNDGSDQVASAANQVSSASQDLAQGSSEQAASVEETSASLEQLTSMTRQNADNATQANTLMVDARNIVSRAGGSMKEMTKAMAGISASGQEIGKIIKTIDEIAFQTNLLALNAAVEAARAGEAGAGFAVVADEVRNLAQRAAEAAKNTASLIEGTIVQINRGTELVRTADEAFTEVSGNASKVAELVGEIAAASREQAQGIDQINQAVSQMDQVTQKNAANAEETSSAAEELSAQSDSMKDIVQEMASMVNGNLRSARVTERIRRTQPRIQQQTAFRPIAAPAKKTKNVRQISTLPKVVKAEETLPMDEDFKDF